MRKILPLIAAGVILLLVAAAVGAVLVIRRKLRRFSRAAFGADTLGEGLARQRQALAQTPKSVSGMTRLCLPQIQADFPDFDFPACRQRAENTLRSVLLSIDAGELQGLEDASSALRRQVELQIADNRRQGREAHYQDIVIHQTEIARYLKEAGRCVIRLQSAVEYRYYALADGRVVAGDREQDTQTKYNIELHYIQDPSLLPDNAGDALGLVCPSCGAPVTGLGVKSCAYCGTTVQEVLDRVWQINRYDEVK